MKKRTESCSLDQVIDAYLSVSIKPNRETLDDWIQWFPEYENELTDFTITWNEIENPRFSLQAQSDENLFVAIGKRLAREAFYSEDIKLVDNPKQTIQSILNEGRSLGISPKQLSDQLDLSISLIRKIDLRYILFETIPIFFIENLSETIKRNVREIAQYLSEGPLILENARFKSSHAPKLPEQRNFFDEVRRDPTLKEEQRENWLSYEVTK